MTSQTKRFLELLDIIGIQLECKKCGISLLVGGDALVSLSDKHNEGLAKCPTCGNAWAVPDLYPARGFDTEIKDFIRMLRRVTELGEKLGCNLRFEVKDETREKS